MQKQKQKSRQIHRENVYGAKTPLKMRGGGVQSNVEMSIRNTTNKLRITQKLRRKIVLDANYEPLNEEFNKWQRKIFAKNARKGYRFFQPDSIGTPTPRSAREAWGGTYRHDDTDKKEVRNQKITACIFVLALILLSIL